MAHPKRDDQTAKWTLLEDMNMSDRKFTFIELHLDGDHQFGPQTIGDALPIGETEPALEDETDADETDAESSSSKGVIGAIVGLVFLVVVAVAVKKYRGGGDEESLEESDEPDIIVN